jgi:hypothetical protein
MVPSEPEKPIVPVYQSATSSALTCGPRDVPFRGLLPGIVALRA